MYQEKGDEMDYQNDDYITKILQDVQEFKHIPLEDLPNIDLYMDQLTTFMDNRLAFTKRHSEDKVLTKTMINNYAKNKILPSPEKKQYTTEHLITLLFIYYFKSFLSITDIQKLLEPIEENYFNRKDLNLQHIYREVFSVEDAAMQKLQDDLKEKYTVSRQTFTGVPEQERKLLQNFSFICELCFDVYYKKMIVEKLIDELPDVKQPSKKAKASGKPAKEKQKSK